MNDWIKKLQAFVKSRGIFRWTQKHRMQIGCMSLIILALLFILFLAADTNMFISGLFFSCSVLLAIAYFIFVRKKLAKEEEAWKWAHQSMATFLSVLLGLSVFSVQQDWERYIRTRGLKEALVEELQIIISQLNNFDGVRICDPQPEQEDLKIFPVPLPHDVIKIAINSTLLEAKLTRHLVLLYSTIQDYNRWAELGFEMLTNPNKDLFTGQIQFHNQVIKTSSEDIILKSRLLIDCVKEGTSSLDADCY